MDDDLGCSLELPGDTGYGLKDGEAGNGERRGDTEADVLGWSALSSSVPKESTGLAESFTEGGLLNHTADGRL